MGAIKEGWYDIFTSESSLNGRWTLLASQLITCIQNKVQKFLNTHCTGYSYIGSYFDDTWMMMIPGRILAI